MATKHFFKTLLIFMVMITLGLLGVFIINQSEKEKNEVKSSSTLFDILEKNLE